jgi:hypothetical protein
MGTSREGKRAQEELLRGLETLTARLATLEARVGELERQNAPRRTSNAGWPLEDDGDSAAWVEELPEEPDPSSARRSDPELAQLDAELEQAPRDTGVLARAAERAEVVGDLALAVELLERLADELPTGRERRRALLHAARLAHSGLADGARALGLARTVLADHPSDAEARKLVSRLALP